MNTWATALASVAANGNLTQLFPASCTVGTGATTAGTEVRQPCEGQLMRAEVYPSANLGGIIELWDIKGLDEGASNNTNTGATLSNAYLVAQQALGKAKLIWSQNFKGDAGLPKVIFDQNVPFMNGLAARFVSAETGTCTLTVTAGGGFRKITICGV